MPLQTRSRAPRTAGGQHVANAQQPSPPPPPTSSQQLRPSHANHNGTSSSDAIHDSDDDGGPPAKKRKLTIRGKQQTTLDHFAIAAQSGQPKPPTKVTVVQPHGKLIETINGVRQVLDVDEDALGQFTSASRTPQPANSTSKPEDKRTLRSQDEGPRVKSELAIYFPNYEEVMFDAPKEAEFVTVDTAIYITDDVPKQPKPEQSSPAKGSKNVKVSPVHGRKTSVNGILHSTPQRSSSNQFNGSPSLNLDMVSRSLPEHPEDPLTDEHFLKSHRRAERKEKQLRNIEKERAMHEKVQLDRLLDGLQGHDWLKVLGITGITDGEAKKYESKRDYFIAEVQALVNKFKLWKEQEKKQKSNKEAAVAVKEEQDAEEGQDSENGSVDPPSSDLNASAARQLQQETVSAIKSSAASKYNKGKEPTSASATPRPPVMIPQPSPEVPITSFYEKRHLRDAALGKARHGRNVYAFGHPVPDVGEREFILPDEYVTEDLLRANARERRRRKRASIADAG